MKKLLLGVLFALLISPSVFGAVSKTDSGTAFVSACSGNACASANLTTFTVTGGSSCLLIGLNFRNDVTNIAVSWDSAGTPQALTRVGTGIFFTGGGRSEIWQKTSPTSGNKNLAVTWTTNSDVVITAIAFTGTETTGGSCIAGADTVIPTGTSTSVTTGTMTVTADGALFGVGTQTSFNWSSTTSGTQITLDQATFVNGAAAYVVGNSPAVLSWAPNSSCAWSAMGVHIIVPAAAGGTTPSGSFFGMIP